MARYPGHDETTSPSSDLGEFALGDEDIARVREVMGAMPKRESAPLPRPRDPSMPNYQPLLDRLMPQIESNSQSPDEFAENLRRTFEVFQKAGYEVGDIEALIATELERYNKAREEEVVPMRRRRREELQQYQDDFEAGR